MTVSLAFLITVVLALPRGALGLGLARAQDRAAVAGEQVVEVFLGQPPGLPLPGQGDEAHMVYQFSLPPLLLHALVRGTARHLTDWAAKLGDPPAGCTFLNFTASHDGIGVQDVAQTITLTGTNFTSPATVGVSGNGVTVSNVVVVSSTIITATFRLSRAASNGCWRCRVLPTT